MKIYLSEICSRNLYCYATPSGEWVIQPMDKAYETLKDEVEMYSIFEWELAPDGTVDVPPEEAKRVRELLEDVGYRVIRMEEFRDYEDGERFTRVHLEEVE